MDNVRLFKEFNCLALLDDVHPFKESSRLSLLDDVHPFKESYRLSSFWDDVHPFKESYRLSLFRTIVCIFLGKIVAHGLLNNTYEMLNNTL